MDDTMSEVSRVKRGAAHVQALVPSWLVLHRRCRHACGMQEEQLDFNIKLCRLAVRAFESHAATARDHR
jgi:hypothetical protein